MVIYTLMVNETKFEYTSENLKSLILKKLDSYRIFTKYIYTIPSDNMANFF